MLVMHRLWYLCCIAACTCRRRVGFVNRVPGGIFDAFLLVMDYSLANQLVAALHPCLCTGGKPEAALELFYWMRFLGFISFSTWYSCAASTISLHMVIFASASLLPDFHFQAFLWDGIVLYVVLFTVAVVMTHFVSACSARFSQVVGRFLLHHGPHCFCVGLSSLSTSLLWGRLPFTLRSFQLRTSCSSALRGMVASCLPPHALHSF